MGEGAFTSAGFDTSSIKRFSDQLAHISVYYDIAIGVSHKCRPPFPTNYVSTSEHFGLYINDATIPER